MYFVGILCLVACVAALPTTKYPEKTVPLPKSDQLSKTSPEPPTKDEKNENEKPVPEDTELPPVAPTIIVESLSKEGDKDKPEDQKDKKESQEEKDLENLAETSLLNFLDGESNELNKPDVAPEKEPIEIIPEGMNDVNKKPASSFLSGLWSYLPPWVPTFPIKWPFNWPVVYRTPFRGYPEYPEYPEFQEYNMLDNY